MQAAGNSANNKDDQVSWWLKLLTRGVGTVGGIVAMILGVVRCLTFTSMCLVGGICEIFIGFLAVVLESPCCCPFLDFIDKIGKFSETRPYWQKAVFYTGISLMPVIMCFSATTLLGSALVFGTGALYGVMALGKKASREEMMVRARVSQDDVEMKAGLIGHEEVNLHVPDSPAK